MPNEPQGDYPFRYRQQYIGFVQNGEHKIYLNAFPYDAGDASQLDRYALPEKPHGACDGGKYYRGAVDNPGTRTFEAIRLNGQ